MKFLIFSKEELPTWEFILIIFLFAIYFLPSFSIGSTILLLLLIAYCGYLALLNEKLMPIILKMLALIIILAFFYAILTDGASISQYASNRVLKRFISKIYQYLTLYFPFILFIRVNGAATVKQKKILSIVAIAILAFVVAKTWLYLIENPNATREWENFDQTSQENIANYYFIYCVPILSSILAIFAVRAKGYLQVAAIACVVISMLFLVTAQYTLSILIAFIGIVVQIMCNIKSVERKFWFAICLIIVVIALPEIIRLAAQNIASEQVSIRLTELYNFLVGNGADTYNLSGRLTLYRKTIVAFIESPIWGNRYLNFDGHATFLTVLADTGLLGGCVFYALLLYAYQNVKSILKDSNKSFAVVFAMFIMMGLTNPIHASLPLGMTTWFLAPLLIQMFFKEETQNEEALEN